MQTYDTNAQAASAAEPPSTTSTRAPASRMGSWCKGLLSLSLLCTNTLWWCTLLFSVALVKLVMPTPDLRRKLDPLLNKLATAWVSCNGAWMKLTQATSWDVRSPPKLPSSGWYLVNCNHQSWVDIFVLQRVFNHRIPLLKFFLKRELIFVPVIGLAWWALDFPFMRRHSQEAIARRPELRSQDRAAAHQACERFAATPTSIMNFAEGTRFTRVKHHRQRSPYRHLLKPKAGALASALSVMGPKFRSMLDVTIVYPDGVPTFWKFLSGRVTRVVVMCRELPVPRALCVGDYQTDAVFRAQFSSWLARLWAEKDRQIDEVLAAG